MVRLNEKQAYRNWGGLWRNRYRLKADAVNDAFAHLEQGLAQGRIEERVEKLIKNEGSELSRAFNTHASFFLNLHRVH